MAITRTQIAKQLLANGGRTGFFSAGLARGDEISPGTAASSSREGPTRRDDGPKGPPSIINRPPKTKTKDKDNILDIFNPLSKKTKKFAYNLSMLTPGQIERSKKMQTAYKNYLESMGVSIPSTLTGEEEDLAEFFVEDAFKKPVQEDAMLETPQSYGEFIAENFGAPGVMMSGNVGGLEKFVKTRNPDGSPATFGYRNVGDRGDPSILIPQGIMTQAPSITEQEPEEEDEGLRLAFRADGGPIGGEYDFESARQMYGLGKLVKKVTRTVKKIAKSPVGKAALLYTGAAMAGSFGAGKGLFSAGMFKPAAIKAGLFGTKAAGTLAAGPFSYLSGAGAAYTPATTGLLGKLGLTAGSGSLMPTALGAIAGTSLIAGLLTPEQEEEAQRISDETGIDIAEIRANPNKYLGRRFRAEGGSMKEQEEEAQQIADETGIDIAEIRANPNKYLGRRFRAEGGSMKEPVAKKTMPLLDMGGKEMDLRAEGGFVPIGRMEKADDVPARLSKNEFVFTADAVRNAGDGNVDKGAEVMYNMMKNLEAGGDVSEESQGLEGARKMFQTSQRLEEVL